MDGADDQVLTINSNSSPFTLSDLHWQVLKELAELNEQYFTKFGFVFLICATGKSAVEMLAFLKVTPTNVTFLVTSLGFRNASLTQRTQNYALRLVNKTKSPTFG